MLNVRSSLEHEDFYLQVLRRIIAKTYVSIMVIYFLSVQYSISGSNIQHSMLALRKYKSVSIYKKLQ